MNKDAIAYYEQSQMIILSWLLSLDYKNRDAEEYQWFFQKVFELVYFLLQRHQSMQEVYANWRLQDGSYGSCFACNEFIGHSQLYMHPQSLICIECQPEADDQLVSQGGVYRGNVTELIFSGE